MRFISKCYFDYKGDNVVSNAYNSSTAAISAQIFMVNSLFSSYKDVAYILLVSTFDAKVFHTLIFIPRKLILGLSSIGFNILCVVSDNNSTNSKAISYFCVPLKLNMVYSLPFQENTGNEIDPLFYVIDYVHILKCIRNNWIAQKCNNHNLYFPDFNV